LFSELTAVLVPGNQFAVLESVLELGLNSLFSVRIPARPDSDPETLFVGAAPRRSSVGIPLGVPAVLEILIPADSGTPFFEFRGWFAAATFGSGWAVRAVGYDEANATVVRVVHPSDRVVSAGSRSFGMSLWIQHLDASSRGRVFG